MIDFDWADKGRSVKDLPEIVLTDKGRESDLSFEHIYELGRLISEGKNEFAMKDIDLINCSSGLKKQIYRFFETLAEQVLYKNLDFSPLLIDLVVFDPEDAKGERFHIAICSTSAELINDYIREVQVNIDGNKEELNDEPQERGPILTNNNIYKSPFFYRGPNERGSDAPTYFHRLKRHNGESQGATSDPQEKGERMKIYFGSFKAKRENKVSKEIQKAHIELFFDIIGQELRLGKGLIKDSGNVIDEATFEFNTSLLIPLLRPAASFVGDKDFRLRGGGLFVYGNTKLTNNHIELVARLQHFFYRNILNESHTQIVYDYLRHEGANHYIHDFKSFLTSELTNKISRVLNRRNLDATDREELTDVVTQVSQFSKYLNHILEAYRDFIDSEQATGLFNSVNMEALLSELNGQNTGLLEVKFDNQVNDTAIGFKAKKAVMEKIFRNLYDNTISEYTKMKISFDRREAIVRWHLDEEQGMLIIEYFNKILKMKGLYLRDFGTKPLQESDSTGLGGYFINNTLSWMLAEENKFPDEVATNVKRFIKCENVDDGVQFSFKFRMQRR